MGKYNGSIVTSAGQSLIANAVASNQKIIFTKLKASTHVYASTTDFEAMTSIADIVQSVDISYAGVYNNNVIQVSGRFTNTGVATAFAINTIGLYGKVGSGTETLVAVVTAVNADTMPVADPVSPTSIIYNIQMTVQNSGVMEVEVNDAGTINVHQFNDALYSTAAITVPTTGWTASGSQYTKTIDVGGITSSSMPFVELQYPDNVTATQKKAIDKAASKLVSLTTTNYGQVVLTATEVPATSFNLLLRGLGSGQYTQPYNEFFTTVLDKEPYVSRTARDGLVKIPQLVGGTVAWNQKATLLTISDSRGLTINSSDGKITVSGTASSTGNINIATTNEDIPSSHVVMLCGFPLLSGIYLQKYLNSTDGSMNDRGRGSIKKLSNSTSRYDLIRLVVSSTTTEYDFSFYPQFFDLTQMFGTAIADYVYSLEQAVEGSGIAWLKSYGFFTKDYYAYDTGSLQSVCTSGRKITALDGTVRTYPIDNEELRGLFKLDANNKLYADGDIYPSSGNGTRNYEIRAYQSGDESLADAITDGTNTVVKLATPTTFSADPYINPQRSEGTEEFVDGLTRDVMIPVGNESTYYLSEVLPSAADYTDGQVAELALLKNYTRRTQRDITNDLAYLSRAVAEQNLEKYGYSIGDYFTGASGYTYFLADMNTFRGAQSDYAVINQNHISIVVKTGANSKWNENNDTSTGYSGSVLHSYLSGTVLDNIKSDMIALFGGSTGLEHLLSHKLSWTTATSAQGWSEAAQYISALTEPQVYGTTIWSIDGYQIGEAWKHLELFNKFSYMEIFGWIWFWLRSIRSASNACRANRVGFASYDSASVSSSVVGLILFK